MSSSIKTIFINIFLLSTINPSFCIDKASFWDTPKHGANVFNVVVTEALIDSAKKQNIQFIRLAPDKFRSKNRDFLFNNTDNYKEIDLDDLSHLKSILDLCHQHSMPVVLTFLSLPGSRWKQHNGDIRDSKLWQDKKFQKKSAQFWQDLIKALKNHPAIVGYNILNEPHPEKFGMTQQQFLEFYELVIAKIREVDSLTPIIIDSSNSASPRKFYKLVPFKDNNIIYSFHMYKPFYYTCLAQNKDQHKYPSESINLDYLKRAMTPVIEFQKKYSIPPSKILVGEFGCNRLNSGINDYFRDLVTLFNENSWHWAFYAYQEDTWDGMDYELDDHSQIFKILFPN